MQYRPYLIFVLSYWLLVAPIAVFGQSKPVELLPSARPSLTILSPAPGEVVASNTVKAIVSVEGATVGKDSALLFWLDVPSRTAENARPLNFGTEYEFSGVPSGLHTLGVELTRTDYTSFTPKIEAAVEFETQGEILRSEPRQEGQTEAVPEDMVQFLPRGRSNTVLSIILAAVGIAILWYVFSHRPSP